MCVTRSDFDRLSDRVFLGVNRTEMVFNLGEMIIGAERMPGSIDFISIFFCSCYFGKIIYQRYLGNQEEKQ